MIVSPIVAWSSSLLFVSSTEVVADLVGLTIRVYTFDGSFNSGASSCSGVTFSSMLFFG